MNFYKRHIGDYIKATAHLSLLEHGVYTRLMDIYYTREAGIPNDQADRLVGARSKEERVALRSVLEEFFLLHEDQVWRQGRCEEEISIASSKADRNREVGKLGGRPRKLGSDSKPTDNPDGYSCEPKHNPIQTPDSRLHSPIPPNRSKPESPNGSHAAIPSDVERVFDHWRTEWGHEAAKLDAKRTKVIRQALKSYTPEQLCTAISGYRKSPHHTGANDCKTVYDALTLLLRDNDHIDAGIKFAGQAEQTTWM